MTRSPKLYCMATNKTNKDIQLKFSHAQILESGRELENLGRTRADARRTLVGDSAHHWTTAPNIPPIQHDATPHLHCHNDQLSDDKQDQWHVAKVNSEKL